MGEVTYFLCQLQADPEHGATPKSSEPDEAIHPSLLVTDKEWEDMLNDSQVDPVSMAVRGHQIDIDGPSSVTGLHNVEPVDVDAASITAEAPASPAHKRRKKAAERKEPLIANPPSIPGEVLAACKSQMEQALADRESVGTNVESQRDLKKRLEEEEKEKKDEKKEVAQRKKQTAAEKAVEKAQEKLAKAQAKAQAMAEKNKNKGKRTKRALDSDFQAVADSVETHGAAGSTNHEPPGPAPEVMASPNPKKRPRRKATASPNIKLSPKAKQFAACSAMASKTAAGRANKAKDNLNLLRDLNIPDLHVPTGEFAKKDSLEFMFVLE